MVRDKIGGYRRAQAVLLVVLLLPAATLAAAPGKVMVGIFPTYDQGGSSFGPAFTQHLTTMIFQELQNSNVEPVLLNPGGLYTATLDDWTTDYAQKNGVDAVLITVLLNTQMPAKGDFIVQVKGQLLEAKTGNTLASWQSTAPINRHEVAVEAFKTFGGETSRRAELFTPSSRPFEKQPLGGAAHKIADDIDSQVSHASSSLTPTKEPLAAASGGSCKIDFKVAYPSKHAASKSYDLIANGKDETLNITDGNLSLAVQSGPLLIQLAVHDSPYKMPKQEVYQTNTQVDCSQARHALSFEIGASGEGSLKWQ